MLNFTYKISESSSLNFEFGYLTYLLLVCFIFISWLGFSNKRSKRSLILRFIQISLLIFAIYPPQISSVTKETPTKGEIFVIDSSLSMGEDAVKACEKLSTNDENIIYYSVDSLSKEKLGSSDISSKLTDLGKIFKELSLKYKDTKIKLCSDGQDLSQVTDEGIRELKKSRITIEPLYIDANLLREQEILVKNITAPIIITQGEELKVNYTIENPSNKEVKGSQANILLDNKLIDKKKLSLLPFESNLYDQTFNNLAPGRHKITISLDEETNSSLSRWVYVKENLKILVVNANKEEANLLRRIFAVLQTDIEYIDLKNGDSLPSNLEQYSSIILNDVPKDLLSNKFLEQLNSHVINTGRDLSILGGDSSFGLGKYANSILEDLSPLSSVPPRSKVEKLPSAVMIVIDKSGSMAEQGKIMAAKLAALSTIESLKDTDYVGVIGFDQGPLSVIEINLVAEVKKDAKYRLQANLNAEGHTNLLPALALANLRLAEMKVGRKHIIVLTDGQIPQSNSDAFSNTINKIRQGGITISTVGLGYEADVAFLQYLAKSTKGSFYQTLDASRLPKIFLEDVKIAVGEDTIKEQSSYPVKAVSGIFESLSPAPELAGFVETKLKDAARLEAEVLKGDKKFPLFASWKKGNGKVYALATDIQGRWSAPWLKWQDLVTLVSKMSKDVDGKSSGGVKDIPKFDFRYSAEGREIKFELFIYDKASISQTKDKSSSISLTPLDNSKGSSQIILNEIKPGLYIGKGEINTAGDYLAKIQAGDFSFNELGITISLNDLGEKKGGGINYDLLSRIHQETSQIISNNKTEEKNIKIFEDNAEPSKVVPIWPFLIAWVLVLVLEVLSREKYSARR